MNRSNNGPASINVSAINLIKPVIKNGKKNIEHNVLNRALV